MIGSAHFIFEDEKCVVPEGYQSRFDSLPEEYSHLYLAVDGKLCAVICIEDPLREEAAEVIQELKKVGIKNVVMMTGDSDRTARAIAARVGVDRYFAEVLPEDKAHFVEKAKANGSKVIMIGDGINDSPALSAADVGIAISRQLVSDCDIETDQQCFDEADSYELSTNRCHQCRVDRSWCGWCDSADDIGIASQFFDTCDQSGKHEKSAGRMRKRIDK